MVQISLNGSNEVAIIDDCDFAIISPYRWNVNFGRYAGAWINGKQVLLHRFVMGAKEGDEVDHIHNENTFDCRHENLRLCTHSQNIANDGPKSNNKLGVKGVDLVKTTGRFRATIRKDYKKIHIGIFGTLKEAAEAYNLASLKYFGEFGYQNDLEAL